MTADFHAAANKQIGDCECTATKACNAACAASVCAPHTDGTDGFQDLSCEACVGMDEQCAQAFDTACFADSGCAPILNCFQDAKCATKP
jgi:hypothetical protein